MNVRAHASLLLVVVVWAGSFSVIKALLDHGVEARDIAILRYAIAAPGFLLVLARARGLPGLTRGDAVRVAAAGLLVVVGYHLCLNVGESHTTSGVAALVVALAPGLTLVLAALVGLEAIGPRQVAGLTIAFAGVAVVVVAGTGGSLSLQSAKGPLIVLGAPLAFALYNVVLKPLLGRHDLLALTAASSLIGTVGLLPFVRTSTVDAVVDVSARDAALLLYLGLLATLVGYILWNAGLRGLGPTRAVSYTYAISPLAVLIGAAVLDEPLSVYLGLGAVVVIGGIALVQRRSRRGPEARLAQWRPRRAHPHAAGAEPGAPRAPAPPRPRAPSDPAGARANRRDPGSVRAERLHPAVVVPRGLPPRRPHTRARATLGRPGDAHAGDDPRRLAA